MNISKKEFKSYFKPFCIYGVISILFIVMGMTKYVGFSGTNSESMSSLLEGFPKVFLAMFGMVGVDVDSLSGYYMVLQFYIFIMIALFAVNLAMKVVNEESQDKTFEFIFTKPVSRSFVLTNKIIPAVFYLMLIALINSLFSKFALNMIDVDNTINEVIANSSIYMFLISLVYFSGVLLICSVCKSVRLSTKISYLFFVLTYIGAFIYQTLDDVRVVKFFTPLQYFTATEVINNDIDSIFIIISIVITIVCVGCSYMFFSKKDISES